MVRVTRGRILLCEMAASGNYPKFGLRTYFRDYNKLRKKQSNPIVTIGIIEQAAFRRLASKEQAAPKRAIHKGSISAPPVFRRTQCIDICELKKRKKFEPTSIALPAASASSIAFAEAIPLLPSAAGQSLWSMIRTGRTSHQIGVVFTRLLSTTWS
jgi:hypothetical protein